MNIIQNYWNNLDAKLEILLKEGAVKLPSLKVFDLEKIAKQINDKVGTSTFIENLSYHKIFLENLQIDDYLTPKLLDIAKKHFNYKGDILNQYHVVRKVNPGDLNEQYRVHFDSHLFTLVCPIKIPKSLSKNFAGQLVYFPNARNIPKNEFINLIGKIYYKKYASEKGLKNLSNLFFKKIEDFNNYEPILFLGKTTLHTNYPVSSDCTSYRLTLLSHFFDDSSKYSVGGLLRFLRNR